MYLEARSGGLVLRRGTEVHSGSRGMMTKVCMVLGLCRIHLCVGIRIDQ